MDTKGSAFDDSTMHFRWFVEDEVKAMGASPRRRRCEDDMIFVPRINDDDNDDAFIDGEVKAAVNLCPPCDIVTIAMVNMEDRRFIVSYYYYLLQINYRLGSSKLIL